MQEKNNEIKVKVINFLKQPLIYVVIVCIIFQLYIYSTVTDSVMTPDSYTYTEYQRNIFKGEVDSSRTPVYPYFIKAVKKVCGEENLPNNVVFAQKCIFIITLILFYYCVKSITKNKILISILTLLFGISPFIILWNVTVLTEPIALFEITLLTLITLQYLKKPSKVLAGSMRFYNLGYDHDKTIIHLFITNLYSILDIKIFLEKGRKKTSIIRDTFMYNMWYSFIRI